MSTIQMQLRVRGTTSGVEWGAITRGADGRFDGPVQLKAVQLRHHDGEPANEGGALMDGIRSLVGSTAFTSPEIRRRRLRVIGSDHDPATRAHLASTTFEALFDGRDFLAPKLDCSILREIPSANRPDLSAPRTPGNEVRILVVFGPSGTDLDFETHARDFRVPGAHVDARSWDEWCAEDDPGGYDIVQIWCHGTPGEMRIAEPANPPMEQIFDRILQEAPALTLLRVCHSASPTDSQPYGVAGELVERGASAVIAFRGYSIYDQNDDIAALTSRVTEATLKGEPTDPGIFYLPDQGRGADRTAQWSSLRFCATTSWIDNDCRIWSGPGRAVSATGIARPGIVREPAPHRVLGGASPTWVLLSERGQDVMLTERTQHLAPVKDVSSLVVTADGLACVIGGEREIAVGVLRHDGAFGWWPTATLPERLNRLLAARTIGSTIEVLLAGPDGHGFAVLDHGGAFSVRGASGLLARSGAALPGDWVIVTDDGRLQLRGTDLLADLVAANWLDLDCARSERVVTVGAVGHEDGRPVLRVIRAPLSSSHGPDDPWSPSAEVQLLEARWTPLPAAGSKVRVARGADIGDDRHAVAVEIGEQVLLWRWEDLYLGTVRDG